MSVTKFVIKNIGLLALPWIGLALYIMLQASSGNLNEEKYTDAAINAGIIFALAVAKVSYSLGYFCIEKWLPNAPIYLRRIAGVMMAFIIIAMWLTVTA